MGPQEGRIVIRVSSSDVDRVIAHFDGHPIELRDGTVVPIDVAALAGDCWTVSPKRQPNTALLRRYGTPASQALLGFARKSGACVGTCRSDLAKRCKCW
jgi:hypothetical protein